MSKKTIFTIALQIVIISVFVFIAAGSGTERSAVRNTIRGATEGGICAAGGYDFYGYYEDCYSACQSAGYSSHCTATGGACFCR